MYYANKPHRLPIQLLVLLFTFESVLFSLEKGMATHSSILAWRIPWTEEPGRLHTVHGITKSQLSD